METVQEDVGMYVPATNITDNSGHVVLDSLEFVEVLLRHAVQQCIAVVNP
jgi:hypothetical protein